MVFVNPHNPRPLYEQIKNSLRSQITKGVLRVGDPLPSVREMAHMNAINPNTIQRAYWELQQEGLIYSIVGTGYFVASPAKELRERRKRELLAQLAPILEELRYLGATNDELTELLKGDEGR